MHSSRGLALLIALGIAAAQGCEGKPSPSATPSSTAAPETATATTPAHAPAVANASSITLAKAPAAPSPKQIAKWSIPQYQPLEFLACGDGFADPAVLSLAVSPDGKQFVLAGAKLTLWNTKDSQPAVEMLSAYKHDEVERPLRAVAISSDGKWIAAGDQKGRVRVWTLADQREVAAIQAHPGHITRLAFSPDSGTLATTSYSGEVNFWQMPDGTKLKSLKMDEQEIHRLAFLSDSLIASAGSTVNIWNLESGAKQATLTNKHVIGPALGLSSDRQILAFNDPDSVVQFWDARNSKLTGRTLQGAAAHLIAFARDGKQIATYSQDSTIRIWDVAAGSVVQVIDADGGRTSALEWLPDSGALLVASELGRVRIWGTPETVQSLAIERIPSPAPRPPAAADRKSLTSDQLQRVIDIRSFPRLPGAVPRWSDFGMCGYTASASQPEAELFYRYCLQKAGWTEVPRSAASQPGLIFRKDGCELNVSFAPADATSPAAKGQLQVNLQFAGNYDVRWLPKISPIDSKGSWESFSSVSYRTRSDLTDCEVALLKQFHDAGWTPYTRLAASSSEEPKVRRISMLQGGSVLTVSIGYPADSTQELFVQTSISVSNKSIPIPPDAGWIEFDSSTDMQFVINTKMDLQQTAEFYDTQMAAYGWSPREAGRDFKDDKAWLPYVRGQQDVFLRLVAFPAGGTRIVAGDAASSSWQLKKPVPASDATDKPGLEAADLVLPAGATAVKFDVDKKQIEFEVPDSTPLKLGEQFATGMESLQWTREGAGVMSDEYVFITFSKAKAEIQLRARAAAKKTTAMISGDGLLWSKPLPAPPVRISYETWLRRRHLDATLDRLDEFAAEMQKIPASANSR